MTHHSSVDCAHLLGQPFILFVLRIPVFKISDENIFCCWVLGNTFGITSLPLKQATKHRNEILTIKTVMPNLLLQTFKNALQNN